MLPDSSANYTIPGDANKAIRRLTDVKIHRYAGDFGGPDRKTQMLPVPLPLPAHHGAYSTHDEMWDATATTTQSGVSWHVPVTVPLPGGSVAVAGDMVAGVVVDSGEVEGGGGRGTWRRKAKKDKDDSSEQQNSTSHSQGRILVGVAAVMLWVQLFQVRGVDSESVTLSLSLYVCTCHHHVHMCVCVFVYFSLPSRLPIPLLLSISVSFAPSLSLHLARAHAPSMSVKTHITKVFTHIHMDI